MYLHTAPSCMSEYLETRKIKRDANPFVARNSDKSACVVLARLVTERIDIIGITTMISIRSHHLDEVLP